MVISHHLKMVISPNLSHESSNINEIWYADAYLYFENGQLLK